MRKVFSTIGWIVCLLAILWMFVSFCDIVADNNYANPVHSEYNFFSYITQD